MVNLIEADLARAHRAVRLQEASRARRARRLLAARRLSRRAERRAAQARLSLARMIWADGLGPDRTTLGMGSDRYAGS